jgi:RNA polymerase sigma factor (TIGR02999 family)
LCFEEKSTKRNSKNNVQSPKTKRDKSFILTPSSFILSVASEPPEKGATHRLSEQQADNVTKLLLELSKGDRAAVDSLLPVIYDELRKLAANYLRRERPDHTLQPTALVHEAYLRLVDQTRVDWQNRAHFFGVAAQIMRRLLVDHARKHNAEKRGQDFQKLSLDENIDRAVERSAELIALDDALRTLATFDEQKARMVELRYFGGLSIEETAKVLGVTPTTIKRHWRLAKAWLHGEMQKN